MRNMESGRFPPEPKINVAIVAHPASPPGPAGGAEMFSGILADSLQDKGPFKIRVYGHNNPAYPFQPGIEYVACGPSADAIIETSGGSDAEATKIAAVNISHRLAEDLSESMTRRNGEKWVVIDNNITTASLATFLALDGIPHILIQHEFIEKNLFNIYKQLVASGSKVVSVADFQRRTVEERFGAIHDVTIKNGVPSRNIQLQPRPSIDNGIRVGTLSNIEVNDKKGVRFACEATKKLSEWEHPVTLSIAGAVNDRTYFYEVIQPYIDKGLAKYVGLVGPEPEDKSRYLGKLHVGSALSNPGSWNEATQTFEGNFEEQSSLVIPEMMMHGVVPVSTDSGGAESLADAGLNNLIVPLSVLEKQGKEIFINLAAKTMLEAATNPVSREELRARVRTADNMGREYADYLMKLLGRQL